MKQVVNAEKQTDMSPWNWAYSLSLANCEACKQDYLYDVVTLITLY